MYLWVTVWGWALVFLANNCCIFVMHSPFYKMIFQAIFSIEHGLEAKPGSPPEKGVNIDNLC